MPYYSYSHPKTGHQKDIFQHMTEPHVYSENGVEWNRVFSSPQAALDTKFDPTTPKDFLKKTSNAKGTMGDLWNLSKEMAMKRKDIMGHDPVKEKFKEDYSKARKGKKLIERD